MDPLVEGQEMGVQQQLLPEDPQPSLKWSPPSRPKQEPLPVPTRTSTNANHPSISILFCTDSKSLCEAFHFSRSIQVINDTIRDNPPAHERVALIYEHQKASRDAKQIKNRKDDVLTY